MKSRLLAASSTFLFCTSFASSTAANLIDRGNGLIFDDVLQITWLSDANLAASETFSLTRNLLEYDANPDIVGSTGRLTWDNANAWIAAMNVDGGTGHLGHNNWRLPTLSPIDGSTFDGNFSNNATTDLDMRLMKVGWTLLMIQSRKWGTCTTSTWAI